MLWVFMMTIYNNMEKKILQNNKETFCDTF